MAGLRVKTLFHPNGEIKVLPEQASTLPVRSYGGARAVVTRCRWEARSAADLGFASDSLNMITTRLWVAAVRDHYGLSRQFHRRLSLSWVYGCTQFMPAMLCSDRLPGLSLAHHRAVGCHLDLNANGVLRQILARVLVKAWLDACFTWNKGHLLILAVPMERAVREYAPIVRPQDHF